jgi:hypothetical protein
MMKRPAFIFIGIGAALFAAVAYKGFRPVPAPAPAPFEEKLIWSTVWRGTSYNMYLTGLRENADGTRTGFLKNIFSRENEPAQTQLSWATIDCNRSGNLQVVVSQEDGFEVHSTEIDIEIGLAPSHCSDPQ